MHAAPAYVLGLFHNDKSNVYAVEVFLAPYSAQKHILTSGGVLHMSCTAAGLTTCAGAADASDAASNIFNVMLVFIIALYSSVCASRSQPSTADAVDGPLSPDWTVSGRPVDVPLSQCMLP
jgi:hypothetical protein